jgi:hypothetical protein
MIPIACNRNGLTPEQRVRQEAVGQRLRALVREVVETEDGYRFALADEGNTCGTVGEFVDIERRCCPFLEFDVEASGESVSMSVRGGPGVKTFIASAFGLDG